MRGPAYRPSDLEAVMNRLATIDDQEREDLLEKAWMLASIQETEAAPTDRDERLLRACLSLLREH
jgi:hypothetical protein